MTDTTRMPLGPLQLTMDPSMNPSRSPAWSPCPSVDTLLSPAQTTYTTTDPCNYKLSSISNNSHRNNNHPSNAQQWSQSKLSPRSARPQEQQLQMTSQLDYIRQLQIMHCQRERDIEQLYRQHQLFQQQQQQQHQQQDRPPSHAIQRGILYQRMLHLQRQFQAQQIQKMQTMHKLGRAEAPAPSPPSPFPSPSSSSHLIGTTASESGAQQYQQQSFSSEPRTEIENSRSTHSNTILLSRSTPLSKNTCVPELAKIVLPSPDHIRKQRQQRLKYQARLRQAAAAKALPLSVETTTQTTVRLSSMPVSPPASPSPYSSPPNFAPAPHSTSGLATTTKATTVTVVPLPPVTPTMTTPKDSSFASLDPSIPSLLVPLSPSRVPKVQPAVWTSSTTSLVPRSKADLQYRRQLRHRLAIQQHQIQGHTHRYRLFQAFCLLQRAQAAQAMEDAQSHRQRQLHTMAWVQALRHSQSTSQLDIPQ